MCRVSVAITATHHSTLLPLHCLARYLTAAGLYAVLVGSKQIDLEVNVNKTEYMVMSGEQNPGRRHNIKIDNSAIQREEDFKDLGKKTLKKSKLYSGRNYEQIEVTKSLLSVGAESFVFQFVIQKLKDYDIQNYNFSWCFVWV